MFAQIYAEHIADMLQQHVSMLAFNSISMHSAFRIFRYDGHSCHNTAAKYFHAYVNFFAILLILPLLN